MSAAPRPRPVTPSPGSPRLRRVAPSSGRIPAPDPHLVSLLDPSSFASEQYRILRHLLEQLRRSGRVSVVAVTSPGAGEGKTTTAINLAGALAQGEGSRVLLVDADLRRPRVAAALGLGDGGPGLVGAILEPAFELEVVTRRRPPFDLWVLPAGRPSDRPYELLGSPRAGELLAEARQAYDFVVVDTPPALMLPDCRALERWVDGFLVTVALHRTPRRLVAEVLETLGPEKLLGIVVNGDDRPLAGDYERYYTRHDYRGRGGSRWR